MRRGVTLSIDRDGDAVLAVVEAEDVGVDVESGEQPPEEQDLRLPVRYDNMVGSHRDRLSVGR